MNAGHPPKGSIDSSTCGELLPEEIGKLSAFLREGLGSEKSSFCDEDVLLWKYFGRADEDRTVSFVARDDDGNICAHVGATYSRFLFSQSGGESIRGMFPTDWLSAMPGAGLKLARLARIDAPITYALGGTQDATRGLRGLRCKKIVDIPVKRRFLSVRGAMAHALLGAGGIPRKVARATRDMSLALIPLRHKPAGLRLERIYEFTELDLDLHRPCANVWTIRTPERMNHLLGHPHRHLSGWKIYTDDRQCGYALLRAGSGSCVEGKIVDCQLDTNDLSAWTNVFTLLTHQLRVLGVDVVTLLSCLPLWQAALGANSYHDYDLCPLMLHFAKSEFPYDEVMLTSLEGDHGYF